MGWEERPCQAINLAAEVRRRIKSFQQALESLSSRMFCTQVKFFSSGFFSKDSISEAVERRLRTRTEATYFKACTGSEAPPR